MTLALGLAAVLALASAPPGKLPYDTYCASCHGADLRGTTNGPSLRDAGAADVDFQLVTGRMPAAVPWIEVGHRGQQLPDATIKAIEAYVAAVAPGGPPIPVVTAGGDVSNGREVYVQNCRHCHGVDADGASVGGAEWAPSLHRTSITQVAEAIRVGPGQMPRFGARQLDDRALRDVATYIFATDRREATPRVPVARDNPVPEGLFGWLAVGALALAAYAYARH